MIDTTIIFFSYFQASSIHYIFWLFEFSSCPLHACIDKWCRNDGHTTLKYPIGQNDSPHKCMVPREEYFSSWSVESEIDKKCGIYELRENIADITSHPETRYFRSHTSKYEYIEEIWYSKSYDARNSYTCRHAKYLIIGCLISSEELARRKMGRKKREESKSHYCSEAYTVESFCCFFPPYFDNDIIDGENKWKKEYSDTDFEFFYKYWSKSKWDTITDRNSLDTKYFSQENTEDIESCEHKKFCFLGGSFVWAF